MIPPRVLCDLHPYSPSRRFCYAQFQALRFSPFCLGPVFSNSGCISNNCNTLTDAKPVTAEATLSGESYSKCQCRPISYCVIQFFPVSSGNFTFTCPFHFPDERCIKLGVWPSTRDNSILCSIQRYSQNLRTSLIHALESWFDNRSFWTIFRLDN